jgi:tRNA-2-methylthio-N6-dimethylallyladenosine synthase
VPYVRGRERSRRYDDIINEIEKLIGDGCKEINLLGQNVNSYGNDLYDDYFFSDLLNDICKINGEYLVRFMTSHPKDVNSKLIDTIASNKNIAKQFHLPLQSGSNRILKEMNRHYTFEGYIKHVEYMRSLMPDIGISTDIIVGFPSETDEDFTDTLNALKTIRYDSIYSFIYSKRKGTRAAEMEGQIADDVKSKRFESLLEVQNEITRQKNSEYLNKEIKILVEGKSKTDTNKLTGRTEKNRLVHFDVSSEDSSFDYIGKYINVKIIRAETYALFGKII